MGLDGVELIMKLEESFGVDLKDDEVVKTVTPRMVGDLIFSKLAAADEATCQTQRAFYVVRNGMMRLLHLRRTQVTPDTEIRHLIPREKESEIWPQLGTEILARRWPELARPQWVVRCLISGSLLLMAMPVCLAAFRLLSFGAGLWGGVGVAIIFSIIANRLTLPFKLYIPSKFVTVRDLIPPVLTSDYIKWTREQVSDLVKKIVIDQLGIPEAKYTEDSHFINDFGLDR